ncbi:S-adenosyl-L-methionine-dependent methyltransferase [Apiospora rasikravindrae]|uniref:S-adenosyl-L-methionine-dependent methyltransferase n=1 Tax=Apiospora rasikravindrae TaxID=990691 RepID=A0ABR1U9N0_9PEZI
MPIYSYMIIETQLIAPALKSARNLSVLDLGGGSGLRARDALSADATAVDVVDVSGGMLKADKDIEKGHGCTAIRWFQTACAAILDHLPLRPAASYGLVFANWLFDHAEGVEQLEDMWRNVA